MFHLLAFTDTDTAATANEDVPGVTDNYANLNSAGHYTLQQDLWLLAAYAQNAGATNARVNTPAFRQVSIPSIQPVNRTAAPPDLPPFALLHPSKLLIPRLDEVAAELSNDGAGGVRSVVGLWVGDGNFNVPQGVSMYTLRCTGTITAVANAWALGTLTPDQTLPYGKYGVVGMSVIGANLVFGRLAFLGGGMRPGVIARPSVAEQDWHFWRGGNFGLFGTFDSTAFPQLEVFATGANAAQTVFLDVLKLS